MERAQSFVSRSSDLQRSMAPQTERIRVLVVDDRGRARGLVAFLEANRSRAVGDADGYTMRSTCLRASDAQARLPDVVLMDLQMAAPTASRRPAIRARYGDIEVVALTSFGRTPACTPRSTRSGRISAQRRRRRRGLCGDPGSPSRRAHLDPALLDG